MEYAHLKRQYLLQQQTQILSLKDLLWPSLQMPPSLEDSLLQMSNEDLELLEEKIRGYAHQWAGQGKF